MINMKAELPKKESNIQSLHEQLEKCHKPNQCLDLGLKDTEHIK